jgi:pimeloyl-ACP methyl ester carboxylesterase
LFVEQGAKHTKKKKKKKKKIKVLDWLRGRTDLDQRRLFVLGRSIGGAVALHLAQERPNVLAGLILENTFTCIGDLVDVLMPKLSYFKFLLRNPWRNVDVVPRLQLPCLFISSGKDELIPKEMMPRLRSLYGGETDSIHFPDAGHMNANQFPGYDAKIAAFIKQTKKP